jgi:hypothetical protein
VGLSKCDVIHVCGNVCNAKLFLSVNVLCFVKKEEERRPGKSLKLDLI